jgi:hypothetical protein
MSGSPRDPARPVLLPVLAATALVVVLATWAASTGPGEVFGDEVASTGELVVEDDSVVPPQPDVGRDDRDRDEHDRGWGSTAMFGLELALLLAFLYVLGAAVRWVWRDVRDEHPRRHRRRRSPDFEVPGEPSAEQAAEEIVRDADDQLALLRDGSPRNGIVACWHRFEVQVRAAGLGRQPWETPAEFTLRVLDLVDADPHAVAELAELYREARFSDHPLREPTRAAAVDALERIHRSLRGRPVGRPS